METMLNFDQRIHLRNNVFNRLVALSGITKMKNGTYKITRHARFDDALSSDDNLCADYKLYLQQFDSDDEALYCLLHQDDKENHKCKICGKQTKYKFGYNITCGDKACIDQTVSSEEVVTKRKETNLKIRGVDNPAKCKEVQEKIKKTNIDKYGCENTFQVEEFKEKARQTNFERRGVEYPMQSEEVRKKSKETNIKKYGVENVKQNAEIRARAERTTMQNYGVSNPFQSEEIKARIKQTHMENLGVEYPMQSEEVREKARNSNLEKYGVEWSMQSDVVRQKARETCIKLFGVPYAAQSMEVQKKMRATYLTNHTIREDEVTEEVTKILNEMGSNYSLHDIYKDNDLLADFIRKLKNIRGTELRLMDLMNIFNFGRAGIRHRIEEINMLGYFFIKDSALELKFKDFLDQNGIQYVRHNRNILPNSDIGGHPEIDFMIGDNLGFEINDVESHNSMRCEKQYHIQKTTFAKNEGVRLIHIWEWELTDKTLWGRLSNWILDLINHQKERIFARNCEIKTVPLNEEKQFLNSYHLQGYRKSSVCYGLYHNGELVQLMSFCKPRYNQNYEHELLRLCTKYGCVVTGGANRLLKHFVEEHNPKSIISYCDLSKFTGDAYTNLGFNLLRSNQPSAIWYNQDTDQIFLDSSLNYLGADKLLGTNYGKGSSNEEIAIQSGYKKIYNCGINVYTLTI